MRTILNVMCPEKQQKPVKGKDQGALLLRKWTRRPFSSIGLGSLCEFVSSQPQHTDPTARDPHQKCMAGCSKTKKS